MATTNQLFPLGVPLSWATTLTGYSSDPSGGAFNYFVLGKFLFFYYRPTANGVSNTTAKTFTIPMAAKTGYTQSIFGVYVVNNGATQSSSGYAATRSGSNIVDVYINNNNGAWTAANACRFHIFGMVEID